MKRFFSIALLWCLCMVANVARANVTDSQGLVYSVSGTNATVLAQSTNGGVTTGDIIVPATFVAVEDGVTYTVTALATSAFASTTYTSVTFEDGIAITSIPDQAFHDCLGISSIEIPEGVTSIGASAFACSTKEYTLTSVTWPSTLTGTLGTKAFSYRAGLTQITSYAENSDKKLKNGTQSFNGISTYPTLWVPCGCSSNYSSNFSGFTIAEFGCAGEGDYSYTYSPDPEEVVDELSTITVLCNDAIEYANNNNLTVSVTNSDGNQVTTGTCSSSCVITLAETITEAGTYTVSIPAGYFLVGSGKEASEAMELVYTVGEIDTSIQFIPADGAVLEEGETVETITVKRNGYLTVIYGSPSSITVSNSKGTTVATGERVSAYSSTATSSIYAVTLSNTISGGGEYTITLAGNAFGLNEGSSELNDETTSTFTILGEAAEELTGEFLVSPEAGEVESISSFTFSRDTGLEFMGGQGESGDIIADWPSDETLIKLYRGDILVAQGVKDCLEDDDNHVFNNGNRYSYSLSLTVPLEPVDGSSAENFEITEPGTYTLYIPPYTFVNADAAYLSSSALTYTYTIPGNEEAVFEIVSPEVEESDIISHTSYEALEAINVRSSITGTQGSVKYSITDTADGSEIATGNFANYVTGDNTDTPWLMATGYYSMTPGSAEFKGGHTYAFNVSDGSADNAVAKTLFYIDGGVAITVIEPELEDDAVAVSEWAADVNAVIIESNILDGNMTYIIYDNDGEIDWQGDFVYENGQYIATPALTITFYEDHTYTFNITLTKDGETYVDDEKLFDIIGMYPKLSEVTITSSVPEADTDTPIEWVYGDNETITLTFSGAVNIDNEGTHIDMGYGSTADFVSIVADNNSDTGYSTVWTLTIGADVLANLYDGEFGYGVVTIVIAGTDSDGATLDIGLQTYYYTLEGYVPPTYPEFEITAVPANGETYTEGIDSVKIYAPDGVEYFQVAEDADVTEIYITTDPANDEEVYWCNAYLYETITDDNGNVIGYSFSLNETLATDGNYMLIVPEGIFSGIVNDEEYVNAELTNYFSVDISGVDYTMIVPIVEIGGTIQADYWLGEADVVYDPDTNIPIESAYTIVIKSDIADGTILYDIVDTTEGENDVIQSGELAYVGDGHYQGSPEYTVTFYYGHTYEFVVSMKDADGQLINQNTVLFYIEGTATSPYSTGIDSIKAAMDEGAEVYNLVGQRVTTPVKGIVNIVKYADGTVKKVLQK